MTKTEKLLEVLSDGVARSAAQIQRKVGYGSSSAVTSAISSLRGQGNCIYKNQTADGVKYRLGAPSRRIVSAAYKSVGSDVFSR